MNSFAPQAQEYREIEELFLEIVKHQRDSDFHLLYKIMIGRVVYVGINRASMPTSMRPGAEYITQPSDQLEMKTALINGESWSSAALAATHSSLANSCIEMKWLEFLGMTLKINTLRGAVLQSGNSWIAFDRERILYILEKSNQNKR